MFLNLLIFIVLAINTFLGIIVFVNKRHAKENQLYGVFVLMMNLWILANYFENEPHFFALNSLEVFLRLDFLLALFVFYFWFLFCLFFSKSVLLRKKYLWFNIVILLFSSILAFLSFYGSWIIYDISFFDNIIHFKNGLLRTLYSFQLIFLSAGGLAALFIARKKMASDSIERRQINFIFFGFFISAFIALIINLFVQPFFDISLQISRFGLYGMTFLVLFPAYAILRHNFLNISIITTEIFIIGVELLLLIPVFQFEDIRNDQAKYFLNVIIFAVSSVFSYLILRGVKKEIELRQEITALAHSLEQANLKLRELDRQKTEFLSIATHQLRTPISIIKGYVSLLREEVYGKTTKKMEEILSNIEKSNEHLVKLIDEFLNISCIEQGRMKYDFTEADLNDIIKDVVDELRKKAQEKNLKVVWQNNPALGKISMDSEKIRYAIYNFIDNAIKYTEKGKIEISAGKENDGVVFNIQDNGIGFSKIDQANFFQKFYRGQNVKGINVSGTGLGLYVCHKFIEAHGGHVWAKSDGLNKGSEFGFWIPEKQAA